MTKKVGSVAILAMVAMGVWGDPAVAENRHPRVKEVGAIPPLELMIVEAASPDGTIVNFEAYDGMGGVPLSCTPGSGSLFPLDYTDVTCENRDSAATATIIRFPVKVQDTTSPEVVPPADLTIEATGVATKVDMAPAIATDAVGVVAVTHDAPEAFPLGTTTVWWLARDAAGNEGKAATMVTVTDTLPPVFSAVPSDLYIEAASAAGSAVAFPVPAATDVVDGLVPVTCSPSPGDTFPVGFTPVTCSATDAHNNSTTVTFAVTVQDSTPPILRLPSGIGPIEGNTTGGAVVDYTVSAWDAVSGDQPVTCDTPSGTTFPLGVNVVHCATADSAANKTSGSFVITVVDSRPPHFISVPEAQTVTATSALGAAVFFSPPVAEDSVGGSVPVVCTPDTGTFFPIGRTEVRCSATDVAGNSADTSFSVAVTYAFNGLFFPYDPAKAYKIGSTLPLRWQYGTTNGTAIPSLDASPVVTIIKQDDAIVEAETVGLPDYGIGGLQYDQVSDTWNFNLKSGGYRPGTYYVKIESELTKQVDGGFIVRLK